MKQIVAFVVCPLGGALFLFAKHLLMEPITPYAISVLLLAIPLVYVGTVVFGIPAWMLMQRYNLLSFKHFLIAGACCAFVMFLVIGIIGEICPQTKQGFICGLNGIYYDFWHLSDISVWIFTGLLVATLFWRVLFKDRRI